jgi:hypothetical protein
MQPFGQSSGNQMLTILDGVGIRRLWPNSSVVRYLEHSLDASYFGMSFERSPARSFRDLVVWQKAHAFVLAVYRYTEKFPEREQYGLAHQLRRGRVNSR